MDLRNLPEEMTPVERVNERRSRVEEALDTNVSKASVSSDKIGLADARNCEQMFGAVPVPVGLAGPLSIIFSSGEKREVYVPLATTEGALVASVNRGAKALSDGIRVASKYVGANRSIAFEVKSKKIAGQIRKLEKEWKKAAESTSSHLKILSYQIREARGVLFLTIAADTNEAMGMNMVTIAAQAVGEYLAERLGIKMLTVAGNVDSDKKPSLRTKRFGRGYQIRAEAVVRENVIRKVLKTDSASLLKTAWAKLEIGSVVAGALGKNLHTANVVAALYLATGQDAAHVVEGSLTDTRVSRHKLGIKISVDMPAILVGVRGGGTELPAQRQCLDLVLRKKSSLRQATQLAETIGAAVLCGEISLLAAQAANSLANSHKRLARGVIKNG